MIVTAKKSWVGDLALRAALGAILIGAPIAAAQDDPDEQPLRNAPLAGAIPQGIPTEPPSAENLRDIEIDAQVRRLVDQLDAPIYASRREATARLREADVHRNQLYALLARGDLSIEQRHRLLSVIRHRLLYRPRGAVGVRMQPARMPNVEGVEITELLPGLPAERVLRLGDRITKINGEPVQENWDLIVIVQTKRPGDTIHLTIQRPNGEESFRTLERDLVLGSTDELYENQSATSQGPIAEAHRREVQTAAARFGPKSKPVTIEPWSPPDS